MIYNKETESLLDKPAYSRGQVIVVSVIAVIVLYALVKGVGNAFGSIRDSISSNPLISSAITVAHIASKLKY